MGSRYKPENLLQRKEFIEVILRLLPYEYPKEPIPYAVERFFKENVAQNIPQEAGK